MSDWFLETRLAWIRESAEIFGSINRKHIEKKFGISTPQASLDLRAAKERWPGLLHYDESQKHYVYALNREWKAKNDFLSGAEKKAQGLRCSCQGVNDYCVCQNLPDTKTVSARMRTSAEEGK